MARQQHSPEEKSRLVLEAIRGERTINEIAAENNIHPNMLSKWKREAETQLYVSASKEGVVHNRSFFVILTTDSFEALFIHTGPFQVASNFLS